MFPCRDVQQGRSFPCRLFHNAHLQQTGHGKQTRGATTYIRSKENLEVPLSNFFDKIDYPVLTDLEMPNLDGFELTRKIKADARFAHLSVVALTSLAGEEDMAKGRAVGIDDYQIKLDREKLLAFLKTLR